MASQYLQQLDAVVTPDGTYLVPISDDPSGTGRLKKIALTNLLSLVESGVTDHGALTGLADDDHTQYALLAGRSGGQTLTGGTAAGENLTLQSTSNETKGKTQFGSVFVVDESNARIGSSTTAPVCAVDHVTGNTSTSYTSASSLRLRHQNNASSYMGLTAGVSTTAKGGANQGHGWIQAHYHGGSNNNPLMLQPLDGAVLVGDINGASWRFAVAASMAVRAPTLSGGGTTMGKVVFAHGGNYSSESAYIAGIYDQTEWYQGAGVGIHTVSGSDISGSAGVLRMHVKSTGQVRFVPLATEPSPAEDGDVYYDSTLNKLRVRAGGAWIDLH